MARKHSPCVRISVVLPCYNVEQTVAAHVRNCVRVMKEMCGGEMFEVVTVNDGSKDETARVLHGLAEELAPYVQVVDYRQNQGKGGAVKKGVMRAKGQVVCYMDSDGEIDAEQLKNYVPWVRQGWDIVAGSKVHPLSRAKFSVLRQIMSGGYRLVNRILFGLQVKDTQAGMKVFSRAVAKRVFPLVKTSGYGFDIEFLAFAQEYGYAMKEVPIQIQHSDANSSVSIGGVIKMFFDTLRVRLRLGQVRRAMKVLPTKAEWFAWEFGEMLPGQES